MDADPARLVQVVTNVLTNAEKFTPREGRVVVSVTRDGAACVVRVRDTGAGIAPDVLPHAFEPFTQAPQTMDRRQGGLGLGLAMVKGLVELHGGHVEIGSNGVGRGTTITVTLPLAKGPTEGRDEQALPAPNPRRVLIIEDNTDSADMMREALEFFGHDVRVAYDGARGVEIVRQFAPEVIICDIGLPGMDGYAVARRIRTAESARERPYLIALTGYAQPEDKRSALEAGFDQHVAKPPALEVLERMVSEAPVWKAGGDANGASARP